MKKRLTFVFLLPLSLWAQSNKEEAIDTFKEIVKCYYEKDCNKYLSFFDDSISVLNKETDNIFPVSFLTNKKPCSNFDRSITKTKSYQNYLENYTIDAVTYTEFTTSDRRTLLKKYSNPESNGGFVLAYISLLHKYYHSKDVLVIGDIPKNTGAKHVDYPYIYLLRKTNKGWRIVGVLN